MHRLVVLLTLWLSACSQLPINYEYKSPNQSSRVGFIILHYTALDFAESSKRLTQRQYRASSHYLIPNHLDQSYPYHKLYIFALVPEEMQAWHAGVSSWQGRTYLNSRSIGIELVNQAQCQPDPEQPQQPQLCSYPDYPPEQIELLIKLLHNILARYPHIPPTHILAHSDIAPDRKLDPGPRFPWQLLYKAGIGAWYDEKTVADYWLQFSQKLPDIKTIQLRLKQYGYPIRLSGTFDEQTQDVIRAFQMHFRPWQVTGTPEPETVATLYALLQKYHPEVLTEN